MTHLATGIGSMPGTDMAEALRTVFGEVGDLPHLPELPARGPIAGMVGRTLALVGELPADLQPAGWRLTDAPGVDQRRAVSLLSADLDRLEEQAQAQRGPLKVQVVGPWTLTATVERPRGDKVLADHGARRDLAQALAEGVATQVADVRRRLSGAEVVLQVDEPMLPAVLAGEVATASGFHRHRHVDEPEAARHLAWLVEAAERAGADVVVHCCAADVPLAVLRQASVGTVSLDITVLPTSRYDDVAAWLDDGRRLWPGLVPSTDPTDSAPPTDEQLTERLAGWLRALGFDDLERRPELVVTPTCGLAAASPAWAKTALALCRRVADNLPNR